MNESVDLDTVALPLAVERQIDDACDAFEKELKRGIVPEPDAYLALVNRSGHRHLLHELTKLLRDYAVGQKQTGVPGAGDEMHRSSHFPSPAASEHESALEVAGSTTKFKALRSIEAINQLDDSSSQFAQALERGELLKIEEIVAAAMPAARPALLRQLLNLEMEFRAKRGDSPQLEEYRQRFPDQVRLVKFLYFENFIPTHLGDFAVQRRLGSGGFGHVYQGWDSKLSRSVAIKVFRRDPDLPMAPGSGLLFEARAAAQLRHAGIVTVYSILADADGDEFLVMEYVDGRSLEDTLRAGPLSPRNAAELTLAVVEALQHSHQHGLVHRDLKPANILLDHGHRPRVTDFGLALNLSDLRRSPEIAGTVPYMAPEQASGETHRLDGRTDLWAVGVSLYRMLVGRLPFSAAGRKELLDSICHRECDDLLKIDPAIPPELARIVRRCLMKRMSERYQTTSELADDLIAFINPTSSSEAIRKAVPKSDTSMVVVPKGLRCFDDSDREFFLNLVPGPRDRHGVPDAIRFWEHRLKSLDPNETFRVGLLYGPSGCGKSSLVRAGIIPRLPESVRVLFIEATRDETELRLKRAIHRLFPELSTNLTLPELVAELREGSWLPLGSKLVVVVDQFEQWLHGFHQDSTAPLVEALRHCDGGRIQALVLVRDDFWMPATRLFQQIDAQLIEGFNSSVVDLFDPVHATKVLAAFGVAYSRIDADQGRRSYDEERFLKQAIKGLSENGWIVPVRLCIFVELIKSKLWTPATLRDIGGTRGLGMAFLEDVFDRRSASPIHRVHRDAARHVLERLLPPWGMDIRGHLVSEEGLRAASGYEEQPADFVALMRCLDQELRLITLCDVGQSGELADESGRGGRAPTRHYQLTHDFLVTAIRDWLNQTRRRSIQGRAELRLAELASTYATQPESRQLPPSWDWLRISLLTRRGRWNDAERTLMRAAAHHHSTRGGILAVVLVVLGMLAYDRIASIRTEGFVQALTTCDSRDLPTIIDALPAARYRLRHLLSARLVGDDNQSDDQRVRILLGLVATGAPTPNELIDHLLKAEPPLSFAIDKVIARSNRLKAFEPHLWKVALDGLAMPAQRLRACMALAQLDSTSTPSATADQWAEVAGTLSEEILGDAASNPAHFATWVDGFETIHMRLMDPLRKLFGDARLPETQRLLAANILARYATGNNAMLLELALQSDPKQFAVFSKTLSQASADVQPQIVQEVLKAIPGDASEEVKDERARRQANAIVLLHETGNDRYLWPALDHGPDPRVRSFLLQHFCDAAMPRDWERQLERDASPGIRQAIILALGESLRAARTSNLSKTLVQSLLQIYHDDADPGVHSAAEWSLRNTDQNEAVEKSIAELALLGMRPGFRWYVTPSRITMIIVEPPGEVLLGSPASEPGRDDGDEAIWKYTIDWSFAISATEITQEQYFSLCPGYKHYLNEYAPAKCCPINAVSWREAKQFCRLLSEHDAIPESEMTLPPADKSRTTPYEDFLKRSGYRLPLEAEWEVACRSGTATPRFYGYAPELLRMYATYIDNSGGVGSCVGRQWPNAWGLFDMLGNVSEWCQDIYAIVPAAHRALVPATGQLSFVPFPLRGGDYSSTDRALRAANRRFASPTDTPSFIRGFRIAHTIRPSNLQNNN